MESYNIAPGRRFVKYSLGEVPTLGMLFFTLFALAVCGFGLRHWLWQEAFLLRGVAVQGQVSRVTETTSNDARAMYRTEVTFTPQGQTTPVRFTSRMTSSRAASVGTPVAVRYRADHPEDAELEDELRSPYFAWAFLGFGAFLLFIGGAGLKTMLTGFETTDTAPSG